MTFEEKPAEPPEDRAGAIADLLVDAQPLAVPVTVEQRPPEPRKPKERPPHVQCDYVQVFEHGRLVGIDITPRPGNAIVRIALRDFNTSKRCKVGVITAPRRGRSFKRKDS